jgi:hypothetical protein
VRAEVRLGDVVRERADRFVLSETARAEVVGLYSMSFEPSALSFELGDERGEEVGEVLLG